MSLQHDGMFDLDRGGPLVFKASQIMEKSSAYSIQAAAVCFCWKLFEQQSEERRAEQTEASE